jgi:hypothetical protein
MAISLWVYEKFVKNVATTENNYLKLELLRRFTLILAE